MLLFIKLYRLIISPWMPNCCRFEPSCSTYGLEAIQRFGAIKGGCLCIWRILRCQPFAKGGYDPVPEKEVSEKEK